MVRPASDCHKTILNGDKKMSNTITVHGKVTTPAKNILVYKDSSLKESSVATIFTVIDIGEPYKNEPPVFLKIHFDKAAAPNIAPYLVKGKEVLIFGKMKSRYLRNGRLEYYTYAENVTLLPAFTGGLNEQEN